jgi:hypothetical protein
MTRRRSRANLIPLRNLSPEQLALDWEREAVPQLVQTAQRIKAALARKPSVKRVLELWSEQRDGYWLFTHGTADPDLFARRKRDFDAAEARMAALLHQIKLHNEQILAERERKVN